MLENVNLLEVGRTMPNISRDLNQIRKAQRNDGLIDEWRIAVIVKNLKLNRGVSFRILKEDDKEIERLVIPKCYREEILKGLHDDGEYPGQERTIRLLREQYYGQV